MKALIAFIGMAVVILTLIEINERIKAKRPKKDCPQEKPEAGDCSGCGLIEVCEKKQ
jgi:hypothetical protein